ncbi:hypothetical protein PIB30_026413 [Stylosanthes scabra]|uniref:Uncharacterized protein n=1 Tax=Stylosanthes scabra TaxID=79078 RepID=A0ABU6S9Y2_9FABA|nr:hypothetical protein [Stylosanthes scabra]
MDLLHQNSGDDEPDSSPPPQDPNSPYFSPPRLLHGRSIAPSVDDTMLAPTVQPHSKTISDPTPSTLRSTMLPSSSSHSPSFSLTLSPDSYCCFSPICSCALNQLCWVSNPVRLLQRPMKIKHRRGRGDQVKKSTTAVPVTIRKPPVLARRKPPTNL